MEWFWAGFWGWIGYSIASVLVGMTVVFLIVLAIFIGSAWQVAVTPWLLKRKNVCLHCRGSGHEPHTYGCHCVVCKGTGKIK